jgi:aminoglycoside 3-N-acetyltransferase
MLMTFTPTPSEHPAHYAPNTRDSLSEHLRASGLKPGQAVIVHTAFSKLGWTVGGAEALIRALMEVLTPEGTLVMPAHTSDNSEPSYWVNPPVPEAWWPVIRAHMPPFDAQTTPTSNMGMVPELFRTFPNVMRSRHPMLSFSAWGANAQMIIGEQTLEAPLGEHSPLAQLAALDGLVLMLGVDHSANTALHLAEHRARIALATEQQGSAMWVNGQRRWVTYDLPVYDSSDFAALGADYERAIDYTPTRIGLTGMRFHRLIPLLEFATGWLESKRGGATTK